MRERPFRAASAELAFWTELAGRRNVTRLLDVPPTVLQSLYQTRLLTTLQSLQVWAPASAPGDTVTVLEGEAYAALAQYLALKADEPRIILHRPHVALLFDSTTWDVGDGLKSLATAMQRGTVVLETSAGPFRLLHPDELEGDLDEKMAATLRRLTIAPQTKLLSRHVSVDPPAPPAPPSPEEVARRFHEETAAALAEFKQRQRDALERRLDQDAARSLAEYLDRYSTAANEMLVTLRRE